MSSFMLSWMSIVKEIRFENLGNLARIPPGVVTILLHPALWFARVCTVHVITIKLANFKHDSHSISSLLSVATNESLHFRFYWAKPSQNHQET